jgi:hypothetical protein
MDTLAAKDEAFCVIVWPYYGALMADNKKKSRTWKVPVEPDLDEQARKYTEAHKVGLASLIRSIMRIWVNPEDPRPLPPGIENEKKRPSRRKKKSK